MQIILFQKNVDLSFKNFQVLAREVQFLQVTPKVQFYGKATQDKFTTEKRNLL